MQSGLREGAVSLYGPVFFHVAGQPHNPGWIMFHPGTLGASPDPRILACP